MPMKKTSIDWWKSLIKRIDDTIIESELSKVFYHVDWYKKACLIRLIVINDWSNILNRFHWM